MNNQRKFVIKIIWEDPRAVSHYIKKIYGDRLERWYSTTYGLCLAKVWKIKKCCENEIVKINKYHTKSYLNKHILEIKEITDNKTIRKIKLKNLNKYV